VVSELERDIRECIADVLARRQEANSLQALLVDALSVDHPPDIAGRAQLLLAEYERGDRSAASLRRELRALVATVPA
jgi:hypothetical protein